MWFVIIVIVIVVIVALVRSGSKPAREQREDAAGAALAAEIGGTHIGGTEVEVDRTIIRVGSRGRVGVAGEYYHLGAIRKVVGRRRVAPVGDWEAGLEVPAYLMREPRNRHDRNAIAVHMPASGKAVLVGYLPADRAPSWQPILQRIEAKGAIAECPARVYRSRDAFQIVLALSDPSEAVFGNDEPDGATFLDARRECAVTGENKHQDVLTRFSGPVWATLHPAVMASGKYAGDPTVEVRIDGERVGTLSAVQGKRYSVLLRAAEVVACEAEVFQGRSCVEIRLFLPRVD